MLRIIALCFLFIAGCLSGQINKSRNVIDSINQSNWRKRIVNTDSLENIRLVRIPKVKIDTLIIKPLQPSEAITTTISESVPVTPYQIMKSTNSKRWYIYGNNNLLFNQSSFSNWNAGGNNNYGINAKVNYNIVYKRGRHFLDNNVQLGYGMVSTEGQASQKTEDNINIMSNYGYDLGKNFYLSGGVQLLTQFGPGYNYSDTPDPTYKDRISKFMAPGYFNIGIGVSYNPEENFQVIFRPITGRFTFVFDSLLQKEGNYGLDRDGQSVRSEIGALTSILYKLKIMKDFTFTNKVDIFTTYIKDQQRVDFAYAGALNIKFNKYISTVLTLNLLYDHDQVEKLQVKQTLGVGLVYDLGIKTDNSPEKKKIFKPFATGVGS